MFQTMMKAMEERSDEALKAGESAQALWFREWARENLRAFDPERKVVYTTAYAFPMELMRAFDVAPFDFELATGMIGSTDGMPSVLAASEERGLSRDVCSFHRASLGAHYEGLFPRPDLLITTSFYCDGKVKTNEIFSQIFRTESYLLYVPCEITEDSVRYVEGQLREIAGRLEAITGKALDEDRLKQAVRASNLARNSRLKILELLKHRPAPWGGRRLVGYSINGQVLSGTLMEDAINQAFIKEMEGRIAGGNLREERHRLYWFAWIPTYTSELFDILKEHQVSVPLCENLRVYWDEIDEDRPFEGLAMKCLQNPYVGPTRRRTDGLADSRDAFGIDGSILFATPACRHANSAYRLLMEACAEMNLPFMVLDMDIGDPRTYASEQVRTRLEGFIELLDQNL